MKLTEKKEQEIRMELIEATKKYKMTRLDALNFVAGYTNGHIGLDDAMEIVRFIHTCDLIKA